MPLLNSSACNPKLCCISQNSALNEKLSHRYQNSSAINPKMSFRDQNSALQTLSSSRMPTKSSSHFQLTLTHIRQPQSCRCKLTDVGYEKMLEANPGNPLLLRNYAKFLHEVKKDIGKAEEFYERAILAGPADGEVISLYAQLIWETHKDEDRAQHYFDRAVQAAPEDCYVIASYVNFLWNLEETDCLV